MRRHIRGTYNGEFEPAGIGQHSARLGWRVVSHVAQAGLIAMVPMWQQSKVGILAVVQLLRCFYCLSWADLWRIGYLAVSRCTNELIN